LSLHQAIKGICKWIDEIVWREFYRNIMHSFPRVSKINLFKTIQNLFSGDIQAKISKPFILAKQVFLLLMLASGKCLLEGWMHNRLRMVVAMFFTKNMLHDWRLGEKFLCKT
jgi:deoxyribodipyrimidine photo-lyase